MEEEIKRLDTPRQLPVSVIMGDLNGLKMTNDVFGHRAGDLLLKKAAEMIKECCRREDIIARWGGDEFVVLLPRTGMKAAEEIVERIKNRCALDSEGPIQVSIALGYATKNKAEENIWQVLKEAEEWMYRHKLLQSKSYRYAVISSLKATLFEKSMETEEHAERLKEINLKTAKGLGLSAKQMDELELLAVLHDIGKVAIKESILLKPGPLTEKEWAEMKKHPEIGYRIAQSTPELASIAEYILCHHERWDGKGYPRGIKGEEIPLLSRILAVADAYDAMTSDRPYRKAMGREEALAELERNAGTQFDPEVVSAFIESCCKSDKNFQE
jgi:diguanylate cyclase (GGDEF)-like protein